MHEKEKTNVQRTPSEGYGVIEMRYLCAKQLIIRSTGEIVDVTDALRLLYIYMLNQFLGFSSRGMSFYKDQREMAAALGWDRKKVMRSLDGLKKIGLVEEAGKIGNSEAYTVYFFSDVAESLEVVHGKWKGAPAWDHDRASVKKTRRKAKIKKSGEIQENGKSEIQTPTDAPTNQNVGLAAGSTAPIAEQLNLMASNDDNGGDAGTNGAHPVSQVEGQQEDPFPWQGDTFIKNRLSENAYQWALTAGATDWRHACCLVWEKIELTPPTEIDEHFKPLSLC